MVDSSQGLLNRTKDRFSFHCHVDLIIDPWPWGGWTTTLQALCAQTPVVTKPGRDARSRFILNAYMSLGLQDLVAHNTSHFVEIARELRQQVPVNVNWPRNCERQRALLETPGTISRWHGFLVRAVRLSDEEFRLAKLTHT